MLSIRMLGVPSIHRDGRESRRFRSRKSWALLAYLIFTERPPSRSELASLLYADADDPLRALRWNLAEIRSGLGEHISLFGDPVVLDLHPGAIVDVEILTRGSASEALLLEGLDREFLEGISTRGAPAFESWLLGERRYVAAATESIIHEAALDALARSDNSMALDLAIRLTVMNPLDENHQALVIRTYRLLGDRDGARRQFAAFTELLREEIGVSPGVAVRAALRQPIQRGIGLNDQAAIDAALEAGGAAIRAGAVEAGVVSLRRAIASADVLGLDGQRMTARLLLAEALIHSWRGMDEEGSAALHEVVAIGEAGNAADDVARANAELGYVDFLRARYDRAERWLGAAVDNPTTSAMARTYLGAVASDRARYPEAIALFLEAIEVAEVAGDIRTESAARTMLGRVHLLRTEFDEATESIDRGIELAERDGWLAYLPWPQSLRGEIAVARGELEMGLGLLNQAFARACQLGDPCWEGFAARGLALAASASGDHDSGFAILEDARVRCNRLEDPYVWLDAYILDAQCQLGIAQGHADTSDWVRTMQDLTLRTGMGEFVVRALVYGAALGRSGDADIARLKAAEIDNPVLDRLVLSV